MVAKTAEQYMDLVATFDMPVECTSTYEKWQKCLADELGMRYSEELSERTWGEIPTLHESLPEVGIAYRRVEMKWGWQGQYISVIPAITGIGAGRVMSFAAVTRLLGK